MEMKLSLSKKKEKNGSLFTRLKLNKQMYILLLPAIVLTLVFSYIPYCGIIIAFKDYNIITGIANSPWTSDFGFKYFIEIFTNKELVGSIGNTLYLGILTLIFTFPIPILLALSINEVKLGVFKRGIQTVSYLPHFLSWIAIIGIFSAFMAPNGPLNNIIQFLTQEKVERIMFLSKQALFVPNILFITIWQGVGWSSILYLAAISNVDPTLYEAATVDGAGRLKQIIYILLPAIIPTVAIIFIMNMSTLFASNFELIYGLQNVNINFETIDTIEYKYGLLNGALALGTAIGFTKGIVGFSLVSITNFVSKKLSGNSLW